MLIFDVSVCFALHSTFTLNSICYLGTCSCIVVIQMSIVCKQINIILSDISFLYINTFLYNVTYISL